jgi:hypothetical protein
VEIRSANYHMADMSDLVADMRETVVVVGHCDANSDVFDVL